MKRRLLVFGMIVVPFILLLFALQLRVEAAPTGQLIRDPRTDAAEAEAEPAPLSQPITVTIYQQVPLTLALLLEEGAQLAGEFPPTTPLTLRFSFQFALTQTLTSTVPSSVSMVFSDGLAVRLPFSLALGVAPSATVVVTTPEQIAEATPTHTPTATPTRTPTASPPPSPTPSPSPSPTAEVTATAELSPTALFTAGEGITTTTEISPIAPISTPLPPVSSRVNITANLRAAPGVDSEVIGQIGLGQPVVVAGLSTDGS
ncbi:MAG TPA: SH3 domain-containing protein, partial [Caldilineaceae bacterium]|nr:SH3 domain-containing protein [Caldilineaceae bacterium]